MRRLFFHIAIAFSFLYLPYPVTALLLLAFGLSIGRFVDVVAWGLVTDIVYGTTVSIWGIPYFFSILSIVLWPVISTIRRRVSW